MVDKSKFLMIAVISIFALGAGSVQAACVKKGAKATAGTKEAAKWYVLETIVQQVDWGAWLPWVSTGKMPGYRITRESYRCKGKGSVTCIGQATVCKK